MSLSALERSVRATHPRCVRVNLRLWYALKSANLISQRELSPAVAAFAGVLLPHFGRVMLVLDPDLQGRDFVVEPPAPDAAPPRHAAPRAAAAPDPKGIKPESPFDRRWMGRY